MYCVPQLTCLENVVVKHDVGLRPIRYYRTILPYTGMYPVYQVMHIHCQIHICLYYRLLYGESLAHKDWMYLQSLVWTQLIQ